MLLSKTMKEGPRHMNDYKMFKKVYMDFLIHGTVS